MQLTSSAFEPGQAIPIKYSCDGANISPPLLWQDVPENAQSLVLLMDDPDAPMGTWDHWLVFNIPVTIHEFKENEKAFPKETLFGKNSHGNTHYDGPCPPDRQHRYFFKLYAIDKKLDLQKGVSKKEIIANIKGHILKEAELIGTYKRH